MGKFLSMLDNTVAQEPIDGGTFPRGVAVLTTVVSWTSTDFTTKKGIAGESLNIRTDKGLLVMSYFESSKFNPSETVFSNLKWSKENSQPIAVYMTEGDFPRIYTAKTLEGVLAIKAFATSQRADAGVDKEKTTAPKTSKKPVVA